MTLTGFHSRLQVRLDMFLTERKELNQQNPAAFPLELDSFLEWQEEFMIWSEMLEERL